MKKRNKKGFILAETITVSVVVMTALILIYTQFININRSYQNSFRYNTVDKLYAVNNVLLFLKTDNLQNLVTKLDKEYLDITSCPSEYIFEYVYCQNLITNLNIKQILFTKEDTTDLKKVIKDDVSLSEEMKGYIKALITDKENDRYRLIVEFNDNTFASLKTEKLISDSSIVKNVSNECAKNGNTCTLDQIRTGVSMNVEVKSGEIHKFYVLSDNGTNLTLLMQNDLDINNDGQITIDDLKYWKESGTVVDGPSTILNILEKITNQWVNIKNKDYSLSDTNADTYNACSYYLNCTSNYYIIPIRNGKAQLPKLQDFIKIGCSKNDSSCPSWVGDNRFWTSTAEENDSRDRAFLIYESSISSALITAGQYTVRPVIVIDKLLI